MGVVWAILIFSFLILFHELGHFVAAKAFGVQVNEFALFMGPAIFKKKIGNTLYSLRCIPIGGYCAMEGEDEDTESPASFQKATWWKRLIILVAGAFMNFVIGLVLMIVVTAPAETIVVPVVSYVEAESSLAGENGLQAGDEILKLDGEKIYVQSDFSTLLALNPSDEHDIVVRRDGKKVTLNDVPFEAKVFPEDYEGTDIPEDQWQPRYGLTFTEQEATFFGKLEYAWNETINSVRQVRLSLQMLLTGKASLNDVSGPVGIGSMMTDIANSSSETRVVVYRMLWFAAFISVNLAVMNMLPIPALDGGRSLGLLLTTSIEAITKKKINPKVEAYIHGIGMVLLLLLMAVVMFKDIFKLIKG